MAKKVSKILGYILIALILVGVVGGIAFFTNGFTDEFKTFYVNIDNNKFLDSNSNIKFVLNEDMRFDVAYTFGAFNKEHNNEYSVKVVPNVKGDNDFSFTVDGQAYQFSYEKDLTKAFEIKKYDTYFTLNLKHTKLQEVLSKVYVDKAVVVADFVPVDCSYFTLLVTSYNGKSQLTFDLPAEMLYTIVTGVELDKNEVTF